MCVKSKARNNEQQAKCKGGNGKASGTAGSGKHLNGQHLNGKPGQDVETVGVSKSRCLLFKTVPGLSQARINTR